MFQKQSQVASSSSFSSASGWPSSPWSLSTGTTRTGTPTPAWITRTACRNRSTSSSSPGTSPPSIVRLTRLWPTGLTSQIQLLGYAFSVTRLGDLLHFGQLFWTFGDFLLVTLFAFLIQVGQSYKLSTIVNYDTSVECGNTRYNSTQFDIVEERFKNSSNWPIIWNFLLELTWGFFLSQLRCYCLWPKAKDLWVVVIDLAALVLYSDPLLFLNRKYYRQTFAKLLWLTFRIKFPWSGHRTYTSRLIAMGIFCINNRSKKLSNHSPLHNT